MAKDLTGGLLRLNNGLKFAVLKQTVYNNARYFYVMRVDDNEEELIEQYDILEEFTKDGKSLLRTVQEPELRIKIAEIFVKEIDATI